MLDVERALGRKDIAVESVEFVDFVGPAGVFLAVDNGVHIHLTCPASPVQFEGTAHGYPLYFRARWNNWDLVFVNQGASVTTPDEDDILLNISGFYDPSGSGMDAGSMPIDVACGFLLAGTLCFRRLLSLRTAEALTS
jgi:hypothetical protein